MENLPEITQGTLISVCQVTDDTGIMVQVTILGIGIVGTFAYGCRCTEDNLDIPVFQLFDNGFVANLDKSGFLKELWGNELQKKSR